MSDDPPDLERLIRPLLEAGEDGGSWRGYYAKGHHDPETFVRVCNEYWDHNDPEHGRYIRLAHVKHRWWRKVPISGERGFFRFHDAQPGFRGAFPATVADVAGWKLDRQMAENRVWEERERSRWVHVTYCLMGSVGPGIESCVVEMPEVIGDEAAVERLGELVREKEMVDWVDRPLVTVLFWRRLEES